MKDPSLVSIHDMLFKMRHLLFGPPDLVTHVNMLDIIKTALLVIRTDQTTYGYLVTR
jgi:hypothetical protein